MNYYPHHIGDFNNATRHLTRVERALYRDLIELYYDTEQPLPADNFDRLARRVLASSEEEIAALRFVLDEFFELDGDVYRQDRCDEEIEKYLSISKAKSKAGMASGRSRRKKKEQKRTDVQQPLTDDEQTLNICGTNQDPLPITQLRESTSTAPPANQKKYPISAEWLPGETFSDRCLLAGVKLKRAPPETLTLILGEFKSFWLTRPEKVFTSNEWEHKFLNQILRAHNDGSLYREAIKQSSRDHSLYDQLTDRSWANGMSSIYDLRPEGKL